MSAPSPTLRALLARHRTPAAAAVIALLTLLAWSNRFMQDDAFISFRYARHLVEGHGLVWNIGERIEGYTNFLWVILTAGGLSLGVDPVVWTQGLGIALFAATLALTWRLLREAAPGDDVAAAGALVLLGVNYSVSIYATGGLETQLQAFFLVALAGIVCANFRSGAWGERDLILGSLSMAGALLTRLDSAIVCATAVAFCAWEWRSAPRLLARRLALLTGPAALLVGGWLLWKLSYYGAVLPNTFRVKGSFGSSAKGLWYLHRFCTSYLLYPVLVLALASLRAFGREAPRALVFLAAAVAGTLAYVAAVGGDFMEFRFLVPSLYLAAPLGAWLLGRFVTKPWVRAGAAALLLYGSLHHATTFRYDSFYEIEHKAMLQGHLDSPNEQWVNVGRVLGEAFGHDPDVRIAVTAAGAIPYYSRLTTIDMLGLSDAFVPTGGLPLGDRPGHRHIAPLSYLLERRVHLAVSHPTIVAAGSPTFVAPFLPRPAGVPVPDVPIVEIPLDAGHVLVAWYLTPDPRVDAAIRRNGWKVTRVGVDPGQ